MKKLKKFWRMYRFLRSHRVNKLWFVRQIESKEGYDTFAWVYRNWRKQNLNTRERSAMER